MIHFVKAFLSFWHFDPRALEKVLRVECVLAHRRVVRIQRRMALMRVAHAEAAGRVEQIEKELAQAKFASLNPFPLTY